MSLLLLSSNNAVVAAAVADKDSVLTLSSAIPAANGSQNNTFIDSSVNNATVTRAGTPAQGSFSPYGDRWSNFLSSKQYLTSPANAAFDIWGANFTVECWINMVAYNTMSGSTSQVVTTFAGGGGWSLQIDGVGTVTKLSFGAYTAGTSTSVNSSAISLALGTRNHIAVTKIAGTIYFYLNGTNVGSGTITSGGAGGTLCIGVYQQNMNYSGNPSWYISDLRIVKGTAVYTANFTPPTTPLTAIAGTALLTCQSNRFKDNSVNNFAVTLAGTPSVTKFSPYVPEAYAASTHGGSLLFDRYSYLTAPLNMSLYNASNYTMEAYVYLLAAGEMGVIGSSIAASYFGINITSTGLIRMGYSDAGASTSTYGAAPIKQWAHLAMARDGVWFRTFVNGSLVGSFNISNTSMTSPTIAVGTYYGSLSYSLNGYIADARVINGTALYTTNFTPPTAPLTAITGTALLLSGTNAGIIDSTANNDLATIGSAQVDTTVKKYGTGSMQFSGTTDYLTTPANPNYIFGTGDFTIECWMYPNGVQVSSACLVNINAVTAPYVKFGYNGTGGINIVVGSAVSGNSTAIPASLTWSHVAAVRRGTALTMYLNGVGTGAITNSTAITGGVLQIGAANGGSLFKGNISDLKISKTAKYAANFTPPTSSF